jgi:hypothetical protein
MTAKLIKDVHVRCAQCGTVFHPILPRLPRTTGQWDKFVDCGHTTRCPRCRTLLSCDRSNLAYTLISGASEPSLGIGTPEEFHFRLPEAGN